MSKKPALRHVIYRELLRDILTGRINPGEKLCESELAGRFHVSRTPIREALLQLEREGLTAHAKNVGSVVKKVSATEVAETYEMVALLESRAAQIAVKRMSDKDVAFLTGLQQSMQECANRGRFTDYIKLNAEFHDLFTDKCGNGRLREIVQDLRKSIYRVVIEGRSLPGHVGEYLISHQRIIEAAAKRDAEGAAELMSSHVLDTMNYVMETYDRLNRAAALKMIPTRWHRPTKRK
jgi:DNA-binding GntR family transcriptional regulator